MSTADRRRPQPGYTANTLNGADKVGAAAARRRLAGDLESVGVRECKPVDDLTRRDLGATISVKSIRGRLLVIHDAYRGNCLWRSLLIEVNASWVQEMSFRGSDLAQTCEMIYAPGDPKPHTAYQRFKRAAIVTQVGR